jgi:hypothetical protein
MLPVHLPGFSGHITGTYTRDVGIPDVGVRYHLSGSGTVSGLGRVSASGWVQGLGFIATGRATGELTLSNAHGTVTLELTGRLQPGFAPLAHEFHFTVLRGTGDYRHLKASGTAVLRLGAPPGIIFPMHPSFTLRFNPQLAPR